MGSGFDRHRHRLIYRDVHAHEAIFQGHVYDVMTVEATDLHRNDKLLFNLDRHGDAVFPLQAEDAPQGEAWCCHVHFLSGSIGGTVDIYVPEVSAGGDVSLPVTEVEPALE